MKTTPLALIALAIAGTANVPSLAASPAAAASSAQTSSSSIKGCAKPPCNANVYKGGPGDNIVPKDRAKLKAGAAANPAAKKAAEAKTQ